MNAKRILSRAHGVTLNTISDGGGTPVVILHGFTGSSESVADLANGLVDRHRTLRIDLIGHGESDAPTDVANYTLECCVDQVADVIAQLATPPVHVIGYSLGSRVALGLCAWRPEFVESATLIGTRAGFTVAEERAQRCRDDEALALRIERDGIAAFVERWIALPLFASQARLGPERLAAAREQRLNNRAHGLANSLRGMGAGAQPPLHSELRGFAAPVRLVVGSEDAKFRALAGPLTRVLTNARIETIPAAGHAAHLENPVAFLRLVRSFLAEVDADAAPIRTLAPGARHA